MGWFLLVNPSRRTLPSHGVLLESRHSTNESGEMRGMNFGEWAGEVQYQTFWQWLAQGTNEEAKLI